MLVRLTVPAVRVTLPVMELTANVPPRFRMPVSTWIRSLVPLEAQLPAVVRAPVLARKVPSLVQLVPVMVITLPAASALMVPWLANPVAAEPTTPPLVPWTVMPAAMSSVPVAAWITLVVLNEVLPAKKISPLPLRACVPAPWNTRSETLPLLSLDSVTLPPASTSPLLTFTVALEPMVRLPASVTLVRLTVAPPASEADKAPVASDAT